MKRINLKNFTKHLIRIFVFGFITICIVPFSSASYDSWPKLFASLATRLWVIVAYVLLTVLFIWIKRLTGSGETFAYRITKAPPDSASEPASETETHAQTAQTPSWKQLPLVIKLTRVISIGFFIVYSTYQLTTMHFTDFRPRDFANLPDSIVFAFILLGFINFFVETFVYEKQRIQILPQELRRTALAKFFREMGIALTILVGAFLGLWLVVSIWAVKLVAWSVALINLIFVYYLILPKNDVLPEPLHVVPSQIPPSQ